MNLLISTRALASLNFHHPNERSFSSDDMDPFRPPLALPTNARNLDIPRFNCKSEKDNLIINMSKNPEEDQNGYICAFSSYEELTTDESDPAELKSVAFNYYPPSQTRQRRFRATPLQSDTIIKAIQIFDPSFDLNRETPENRTPEKLLIIIMRWLDNKLPNSANLHKNLDFIRDYMVPLLQSDSGDCWERERMERLLSSSPVDDLNTKRFVTRWLVNNLPYRLKIISHKTDGAHRDFAEDALHTGSFIRDEHPSVEKYFLMEPRPQRMINVDCTIPTIFNKVFLRKQQQSSQEKQSSDGKDKELDILDLYHRLKDYLDDHFGSNIHFLTDDVVSFMIKPSGKTDFLQLIQRWRMPNDNQIAEDIAGIHDNIWEDVAGLLLQHYFIEFIGTQILEFLLSKEGTLPPFFVRKLETYLLGDRVYDRIQKENLEALYALKNWLLLPISLNAHLGERYKCLPKGFYRFDYQSNLRKTAPDKNFENMMSLMSRNMKLFSDPIHSEMKFLLGNPNNGYQYDPIHGPRAYTKPLPASFVSGFFLLLLSYLSREVSDEVRSIFGKSASSCQMEGYSTPKSAGDEEKAVNFLLMSAVKVIENYSILSASFKDAYDNLKPSPDAEGKPLFRDLCPILMNNALLAGLRRLRLTGIDPAPTPNDRMMSHQLLKAICTRQCCNDAPNCDCVCEIWRSITTLRVVGESFCTLGRRGEVGQQRLLDSLPDTEEDTEELQLSGALDEMLVLNHDDRSEWAIHLARNPPSSDLPTQAVWRERVKQVNSLSNVKEHNLGFLAFRTFIDKHLPSDDAPRGRATMAPRTTRTSAAGPAEEGTGAGSAMEAGAGSGEGAGAGSGEGAGAGSGEGAGAGSGEGAGAGSGEEGAGVSAMEVEVPVR
jgi:hypothetical protein